jgi:hypothetical protein
VAERTNLRYFLALGMITSGLFTYLFGITKSYGIHYMWYFMLVQVRESFLVLRILMDNLNNFMDNDCKKIRTRKTTFQYLAGGTVLSFPK